MVRMNREPLIANVLKDECHAARAGKGAAVFVKAFAAPGDCKPDHLVGSVNHKLIEIEAISLRVSPDLAPLLFLKAIEPANDSGDGAECSDMIGEKLAAA